MRVEKRRVERDWNLKVAFYWTIATRRLGEDILIKLIKTAWDMAALRRWDGGLVADGI